MVCARTLREAAAEGDSRRPEHRTDDEGQLAPVKVREPAAEEEEAAPASV